MSITNHELHDKDFYAWTKETSQLLRNGKIDEVHIMDLSEELEELGMGNKRAVISQLSRLIAHLLKWKYQPGLRGTSWKTSINGARLEISYFFEDSKLLRKEVEENFMKAYKLGIQWASSETGIEVKTFPKECPFTLEQCVDENFLPE